MVTLNFLAAGILILPLAGFLVLSLFGEQIRRDREQTGAAILACVTVVASFGFALAAAFMLHSEGATLRESRQQLIQAYHLNPESPYLLFEPYYDVDWISVGAFRIPFAFLLDPLSTVMTLVVTGIGSLIHIYSVGYMAEDDDKVRYFSYLNLFTFFMLVLVMGSSLPLMFVGWEGVGLCSYLLIGFWYRKKSATDAGKKAFIVNRIGDVGILLGTILAFHAFGTVSLFDLAQHADALPREALGQFGLATTVCLLLFLGACGKSAQIPLQVWLPDAMEGPTPVSALIHAATMVTAGVYMVARLSPLFARSETALFVIAVVGTATAFVAGTIALVQTDIKKVLAYSTISQLGYMFLACGVGAFGFAIFHLYTHAFFKALLFLGSGSVIHGLAGEQDMRKMGGLRTAMPWTFATFLVGTLAIAGLPPLAGFFSKDGILAAALASQQTGLFAVGFLTAGLTAFYMGRLFVLTFLSDYRGGHDHHPHESPWVMLGPLVILALGSVGAGWVNIPGFIHTALRAPEPHEAEGHLLPVAATLMAVGGLAAAYWLYLKAQGTLAAIAAATRPLGRLFEAKWGFDDAYNWFARVVVVRGSEIVLWEAFDKAWIDGLVNGVGSVTTALATGLRPVQTGLVRGYVLVILTGAVALAGYLVWFQG